jgi:hypothetical protein
MIHAMDKDETPALARPSGQKWLKNRANAGICVPVARVVEAAC